MKKIFHWNNLSDINQLADSICNDEICLSSTDTVLGLLGTLSQNVFNKLNRIKERNEKPYIILMPSVKAAQFFSPAFQSENMAALAAHCWPGPVTLLVNAHEHLPGYMKSLHNTVALRVPAHQGLLTLLQQFDGLFSTSANKTGQSIPTTVTEVNPEIFAAVSHIIIDPASMQHIIPSTILDCTGPEIVVIRSGAYPIEQLEKIWSKRFIKK